MHIVTPICIFFVRRAVRSPLCAILNHSRKAWFSLPLYHSKVLYSFYLHFMHTLRQSPGQAPGLCCALFRAEIKKPRAAARGLEYQIFASASDFLGLTIAARPSASRPKMTAGSIQYRPMSYRGRFSIAGTLNAHRMLAPTAPRAAPRLT